MSAPVLSWLFNMARETAETAPPCGTAPRHTLASPTSVAVLREVRFSYQGARESLMRFYTTQPLEPIFFPKLQIYLADFPYLHCSID